MSQTVTLSTIPGTNCRFKPVQSGGQYLSCNVKEEAEKVSAFMDGHVICSRPVECENPQFAHKHAMGICQFKCSNGTRRCGCPELNNEKLWNAYVSIIVEQVVTQSKVKNEITVTFFATGYLGNENRLISLILKELGKEGWKGKLYFQFVDPEYTARKTNAIVGSSPSKKVQWGYLVTAGVCEIAGIAAIGYGMKSSDKEKRNVCIVSGAILMALGIIVGSQAFVEGEEDQKGSAQMKGNIFEAVQGTQTTMQQSLSRGITIQSQYFPSGTDCQKEGKRTDLLVGYDIGNTLEDFRSLKENSLSGKGIAIVVGKDQNGTFMLGARGIKDALRRMNWAATY